MRRFNKFGSETSMETSRLETPASAGFRSGMSSPGVIGRKLGAVLGVDTRIPDEMDTALRQLQDKLKRSN
jgi:hypothetical protein